MSGESTTGREIDEMWGRGHSSVISCRIRRTYADRFHAYCKAIGQSPSAVLKAFILRCINNEEAGAQMEGSENDTL